jgi:hypothetical protein
MTELREREWRALEAVFRHLEEYITRLDGTPYFVPPIVSDEKWEQFLFTFRCLMRRAAGGARDFLGRFLTAVFRS